MTSGCNVADDLRHWAAERGSHPALRFPSDEYRTQVPVWNTWTFAELDMRSDAYARGFQARGVRPGDRTLMLMKPSLEFYAVLFGLFKLGAVPVLLDPGMGMRNLMICIARTRPKVMVAMPAVHAVATFWRGPFASVELKFTDGRRWFWGGDSLSHAALEADEAYPIHRCSEEDDAAIIFTSGSTGPAKGVASKHGMFRAQVRALRDMMGFEPGQTDLQCFAAFAIFDLCLGMTSVLPQMNLSKPATADPTDIAAAMIRWEPEVAFASPIVWQNLSRHCIEHQLRLPSLQTAMTVGAPIPAYLHRRFREILDPGCQIHTPYGATEGLPVSHIATDEILSETWERTAAGHGTCVGHPAPGIDIRIIDIVDDPIPEWSESCRVDPGEIGEVVISGPQVSPEYKDAPDANHRAKIREGARVLHRMGDLGYFDDQGRLWFCGRKAHRIETDSGLVPAVPVEGVFNEHPGVFRTALVGLGSPGQQVPVLCVELEPNQTWTPQLQDEVSALAQDTRWDGVVQRILAHPGFPTDARHNSKIRREDLREWARAQCPDLIRELTQR